MDDLKIVAHNSSAVLGGGEIWLALLLAEFQRRGHNVLMQCRNADMAARAASYGIPTEVFHIGGDVMVADAVRYALRLRKLKPDALILSSFKKVWLGGMGAHLARVPRVVARVGLTTVTPHNITYRLALSRWVDVTLVNAEEIREIFLQVMPSLEPDRVMTVLDGIITPRTAAMPDAVRRELGLTPETRVIGSMARLSKQKRFDRLLRAVAALPGDVHCVIAGEGKERASLEALAAELNVEERVHFIGFRRDVRSVLDALDVFVLASDAEGMANAMLEAMAAGVPVVSTRVSGAPLALAAGGDGIAPGVVVGFDAGELAAALRTLLDDVALRGRMGQAGIRRVAEKFDFEQMVDAWEAVLRS